MEQLNNEFSHLKLEVSPITNKNIFSLYCTNPSKKQRHHRFNS